MLFYTFHYDYGLMYEVDSDIDAFKEALKDWGDITQYFIGHELVPMLVFYDPSQTDEAKKMYKKELKKCCTRIKVVPKYEAADSFYCFHVGEHEMYKITGDPNAFKKAVKKAQVGQDRRYSVSNSHYLLGDIPMIINWDGDDNDVYKHLYEKMKVEKLVARSTDDE